MKVLIACNSFKECATSSEVNEAVAQGVILYNLLLASPDRNVEIQKVDICDGGTGFCSILSKAVGGGLHSCMSKDSLLRDISSAYGYSSDKKDIFVEVAETCGLAKLNKNEQNPINTTSHGVGLQIVHAIDNYKPERIFVGCGDTAINDFGIGFLNALGAIFYDANGNVVKYLKPSDFLKVESVDITRSRYIKYLQSSCQTIVCCNLSSIVGGKESNTRVYARQKGASESEIVILEKVRDKFLSLIERITGNDISLIPGTGAGGGIGASLYAFCKATLSYSFESIFPVLGLDEKVRWADIIITGEGLLDSSSLKGKAPISLALFCKKYDKKVALITGSIKTNCTNVVIRGGVDYIETLSDETFKLQSYIDNAKVLLRDASFRLMKKIERQNA